MIAKPLTVSIPHDLGKTEARRRLELGFVQAKQQFAGHLAKVDESWEGDRMTFAVGVFGQNVSGNLEVLEDSVKLEVQLPWFLRTIAEKAKALIQKQGQLMLEKK